MASNGVDPLYYQNLEEWVYDEKKLVTYHYLSVTLGVHINMAKQMLYDFYTEEKKKQEMSTKTGRKLRALFLVSGTESRTADKDLLKFTVTLCPDDKFIEHKKQLKSIFSVHIYSVQSETDDCVWKLNQAADEVNYLRNLEGLCGSDFGPFKRLKPLVKEKLKFKQTPVVDSTKAKGDHAVKEIDKPKEKFEKTFPAKGGSASVVKKKGNSSSNGAVKSSESQDSEAGTSMKRSQSKKNIGEDKARLKSMFAAAAALPRKPKMEKPPEVKHEVFPVESSEDEDEDDFDISKSNGTGRKSTGTSKKSAVAKKPQPQQKKMTKKEEPTRKRRRIKDVFSSSSDEESETRKMTSDEDATSLPESPTPTPKKRFQIDSDEDDKIQERSNLRHKVESPKDSGKHGKSRVSKTVSKTFMQDDGYMLTLKEQVLVSASESDDQEDPTPKAAKKLKLEITERRVSPRKKDSRSVSPQPNKKAPKKLSNSNSQDSKMKQQSLTQFFKKK